MKGDGSGICLFIDPPSRHFLGDAFFDPNDKWGRMGGDRVLTPYAYLRDWFVRRGIRVHTADRLMRGEVCGEKNVYISMGIEGNYSALARRRDVTLSAFFALECPIVQPAMYRGLAKAERYFKRVCSFSDADSLKHFLRRPVQLRQFHIPQSFDSVHEEIWRREDRDFLVMINKNRLPAVYWQELYTERLRALEYFGRLGEIDLYGVGWDGPPYQPWRIPVPGTVLRWNYQLLRQWQRLRPDPRLLAARRVFRGPATSKPETLGNYTFALCFENMILKGWITEKIFDCFYAGTIPVYWGEPEIEAHIPGECFIDMRQFGGYPELRTYLKSLGTKEIRRYKESARDYLQSPAFRPFTKAAFVELVARIVEEDTGFNCDAFRGSEADHAVA